MDLMQTNKYLTASTRIPFRLLISGDFCLPLYQTVLTMLCDLERSFQLEVQSPAMVKVAQLQAKSKVNAIKILQHKGEWNVRAKY